MLQFVDRGDRFGLAMLAGPFHDTDDVDQPGLALDLATTWFFAGSEAEAESWCARASSLIDDTVSVTGPADVARRRLHAVRCFLALYQRGRRCRGRRCPRVRGARAPGRAVDSCRASVPDGRHRVALARGDLDEARRWLVRAKTLDEPAVLATVTVPALEAWFELLSGRLARAIELADAACSAAEHVAQRPHHDGFDAVVVAARAQFAAGDLGSAQELRRPRPRRCHRAGVRLEQDTGWTALRAGVGGARRSAGRDRDHPRRQTEPAPGRWSDAHRPRHRRGTGARSSRPLRRRVGVDGARWRVRPGATCSSPACTSKMVGPRRSVRSSTDVDGWLPSERLEGYVLRAAADATGAAAVADACRSRGRRRFRMGVAVPRPRAPGRRTAAPAATRPAPPERCSSTTSRTGSRGATVPWPPTT